ncbi:MAG: chromate transporter [Variovorax sp.]
MSWQEWLALFAQFLLLSLLSISGAITTVPEMHRYLVDQQSWLTPAQFSSSVAIAQAAPGPNLLFVALMGWNVGLNAGGGIGAGVHAWLLGLLGLSLALIGILVPSSTITWFASRWAYRNRTLRGVRAFKQGMSPIVVGLLISTGWVLTNGNVGETPQWHLWLVTAVTVFIVWRTRIHLLWLLGAGAVLGVLGFV